MQKKQLWWELLEGKLWIDQCYRHRDGLCRVVPAVAFLAYNLIYDFDAGDNLAENGVLSIKERTINCTNKELASAAFAFGVHLIAETGGGYGATEVLQFDFRRDGIIRAACTVASALLNSADVRAQNTAA